MTSQSPGRILQIDASGVGVQSSRAIPYRRVTVRELGDLQDPDFSKLP